MQVPAQDALHSALSLDPQLAAATNSPASTDPAQPYWRSLSFHLGSYLLAQYNDNFFETSSNPEMDVSVRGGINLQMSWIPSDRSELRFSSGIGYVHYGEHSAYSGLELSPDSALTYSLRYGDTTLTAYDQFSYWREVATEGALANIATLPRLDNTLGARFSWEPDHWRLQAGYGHEDFMADNSANAYLNRASEQLLGRIAWRLAENSEAGVEGSGSFTTYREQIQSDNQNFSIGPYADLQLRPSIHLSLRGGPAFYFFDPLPDGRRSPDLLSYYLSFNFHHQLTGNCSYELNLRREVQPGLNQGSDYIEQLSASYTISYALTSQLTLAANLTYENGTQPLPLFIFGGFLIEGIEHFERVGGGPRISWRLTDKFTASLDYAHWQRTSDFAGRGYDENIVGASLAYAF